MARTALLIKPSIEEIKLQCAKIGLPPIEAEKFLYHHSARGWRLKGGVPMTCWRSALQTWRLNWQQYQQNNRTNGANTYVMQKEFDRVLAKMKSISDAYGDHQDWNEHDCAEFKRLKARKAELMKALGVTI